MTTSGHDLQHEDYWQRVWRRFEENTFGRYGLGVIIALFVLAALAPFLANSHALVRVVDGHLSCPIFPSLEPIEWRFLIYVPLAVLFYELRLRFLPRSSIPFALVLVVIAATELALALTHPVNDSSNDRDFAGFKLMPPIPYSPVESSTEQFAPPSWRHLCGTDITGRDIAARMLHGARTSLSIGFVAQTISVLVGVTLGGLAGYFRGVLDIAICRFIEILDCFPPLILILVVIGLSGSQNNMFVIMAVIGLTSWTGLARLVRGEFLRLVGQPFPQAAKALGAGNAHIIIRHLLPNALGPILVSATFGVASAILIESSLSFLGFGMQAPTPSWGDILNEARYYIDFAWWLAFFPASAILITIMSYNFVGEALRDAVDPRLKVK
jgi:peptide/nickel transport system permease protein